MKQLIGIFVLFFACSANGYAQAPKCPPRDFDCELAARMKALETDPRNPENYYNLALLLQASGNHKQAVEIYSMYVSIPDLKADHRADGYNNRGISYRALKQLDLARADYTKAIELNPALKARFLVNRGNAAGDAGKPAEALADYTAAIASDEKYGPAYSARGSQFHRGGRLDEAVADLTKAIELGSSDGEAFYTRALVFRVQKDYKRSIEDLDKYIALSPRTEYLADAYVARGVANALSRNHDAAINDLSKAIELSPKYVDAYRARALSYREIGKKGLAEADEKRARDLGSN